MKKTISALIAAMAVFCAIPTTAYASEWLQGADGRWWYQHDDGSCTKNGWEKIDGKDYYFDADGWMLSNTTTPDGYQVGADGAWVDNTANLNVPSNPLEPMTERQLSFFQIGADGKYYFKQGDKLQKESLTANEWISIGKYGETEDFFSADSDLFVVNYKTYELLGEGWYWIQLTDTDYGCVYVGPNYKVMRNCLTPDGYQTNEDGLWVKNGNIVLGTATTSSSNGSNKSSTASGTGTSSSAAASSSSEYAYLAAMDFRGIKSEYPNAEPLGAYVKSFKLNGDKCAIVYLQYKIINNYSETFMHNISEGTRITDPVNYYKKQGSRAFGKNKIKAIDDQTTVLKAISAAMQNGEYISPSLLDPQ